jgi:hypothetical protein
LPSLGTCGGMDLVRQARKNWSNWGTYLIFHFCCAMIMNDVHSCPAVKTASWNLAVSGKVSRSAEFNCIWAYGVCMAGAPKRAEQGFHCKKSAKSAISPYKVSI